MSEAEKIAAGLTKANQSAVHYLSEQWEAGPQLPDGVIPELARLRDSGLVERVFGDMAPPVISSDEGSMTMGVSACWMFRLTPLGLEIRTILQRFPATESSGTPAA